jgi:hypothetical protein
MSSAPSVVQHTPELPGATAGCPVCPHPLDAHDPISLRFCRATTAGATTRGCVCPSH